MDRYVCRIVSNAYYSVACAIDFVYQKPQTSVKNTQALKRGRKCIDDGLMQFEQKM